MTIPIILNDLETQLSYCDNLPWLRPVVCWAEEQCSAYSFSHIALHSTTPTVSLVSLISGIFTVILAIQAHHNISNQASTIGDRINLKWAWYIMKCLLVYGVFLSIAGLNSALIPLGWLAGSCLAPFLNVFFFFSNLITMLFLIHYRATLALRLYRAMRAFKPQSAGWPAAPSATSETSSGKVSPRSQSGQGFMSSLASGGQISSGSALTSMRAGDIHLDDLSQILPMSRTPISRITARIFTPIYVIVIIAFVLFFLNTSWCTQVYFTMRSFLVVITILLIVIELAVVIAKKRRLGALSRPDWLPLILAVILTSCQLVIVMNKDRAPGGSSRLVLLFLLFLILLQVTSICVMAVAVPRTHSPRSLAAISCNAFARDLFAYFCRQRMMSETPAFLLAARQCRISRDRLGVGPGPVHRTVSPQAHALALAVYRDCIGEEAPQPVHVPVSQLRRIREELDSAPSRDVFRAVEVSALRTLHDGVLGDFLESELYQLVELAARSDISRPPVSMIDLCSCCGNSSGERRTLSSYKEDIAFFLVEPEFGAGSCKAQSHFTAGTTLLTL